MTNTGERMTTILRTIVCFLLLFNFQCFCQSNQYALKVSQKGIIRNGNKFLVPVELENTSKDTLSHWEMSCSWQEHYVISDKNLRITILDCDKNIPKMLTLKPGGAQIVYLEITGGDSGDFTRGQLRIGFYLIASDPSKKKSMKDLHSKKHKKIIWSNEFELI